jgi:DNA-binding protein YbaB
LSDDDNANPYNMKKPWHKSKHKEVKTADSMFYGDEDDTPNPRAASTQPGEDWEKRFKGLQKTHQAQKEEWQTRMAEIESQLSTKEKAVEALPNSAEELDKLKAIDPILFAKVEKLSQYFVQRDTADIKTKIEATEKKEYELAKKEARAELLKAHPDVYTVVETDEFKEWAENQPKEIQNWVYNNPTNSALAIKAIGLFKAEVSTTKKESRKNSNQSGLDDASSLVSTRMTQTPADTSRKTWTRQEIQRLSMEEYDKYEAEIDLAVREGRVK